VLHNSKHIRNFEWGEYKYNPLVFKVTILFDNEQILPMSVFVFVFTSVSPITWPWLDKFVTIAIDPGPPVNEFQPRSKLRGIWA